MTDVLTTRLGDQVTFLEGAFVSWAKGLVVKEITAQWPTLFAIPVLGPFATFAISRLVSKVLGALARNADFQLYFVNTRRRADAQAARFYDLLKARQDAKSPEDLNRAEEAALKSFDDVVRYKS